MNESNDSNCIIESFDDDNKVFSSGHVVNKRVKRRKSKKRITASEDDNSDNKEDFEELAPLILGFESKSSIFFDHQNASEICSENVPKKSKFEREHKISGTFCGFENSLKPGFSNYREKHYLSKQVADCDVEDPKTGETYHMSLYTAGIPPSDFVMDYIRKYGVYPPITKKSSVDTDNKNTDLNAGKSSCIRRFQNKE